MNLLKTVLAMIAVSFLVTACVDDGVNRIILDAKEGIVVITAEKTNAEGQPGSGIGTGFFIGDNVIITNNHVVDGSTSIKLALEDSDEFFDADVVSSDAVSDLAVIRVRDWDKFKDDNHFRVLRLADKHDVTQTQTVYAIGHPWGLAWSVSRGIVSAVDRKPGTTPKVLIQTDAHVYNGNSGGPLLNDRGEVLGINSLMYAQEGGSYGFALPVVMIEKVLHDLEKHGEVHWALLGVSLEDDNTVKEMTPDKPAEKSGLRVGDVILEFTTSDGTFSAIEKNLPVAVASHDPDQPVLLKIKRGEEILAVRVDPVWRTSEEILGDSTPG